ncbi:MAG: DUF2127 domain-containing protein [Acidobacteriota bacterium]|nr:DUF2127 domain-containing protein [Acidobacteriota bacterium]
MEKIHTTTRGVHLIAIFEAFKGLLGIAAIFGLLSLRHKDLQESAVNLINHLHFDPSGELAQKFIETAGQINDSNIAAVVVLCIAYVIIRFTEAYGLWFLKAWAEWFAIISGSLYIPFEIYKLLQKPTFTRAAILLFNVAIVIYLWYFRKEQKHEKEIHDSLMQSNPPVTNE